jgi:hypothetical protein
MKTGILTEKEATQSRQLMMMLNEVIVAFAAEEDVKSLGVIVTALSSLLMGGIASSVPVDEWAPAIDLIFDNIKKAAKAQAEQPNNARIN